MRDARLLNFCYRPTYHVDDYQAAETIYRADEPAPYRPVCGTPYYWNGDNAPGCLLGTYLPRRGALTIPHIVRAKALLALTPAQEAPWASLEAALRQLALVCYDRVKPAEKRRPLDPDAEARLATQARPLLATLDMRQKRLARRLFRAMGFSPAT